jgi:hypothetical protein
MEDRPIRSTALARRLVAGLAAAVLLGAPARASAQEPVDSVRAELARLAAMVDSLSREVARLRAQGQPAPAQEDALARLRAAADSAAGRAAGPAAETPAQPQEFVGRQRSLQALNPEVSVTGDILAQPYQSNIDEPHFFPREFELSFVSNLDPYSRAKVFASHHTPGGEIIPFGGEEEEEGGGMAVEEGYIEWVGLPGGLGLKAGLFYQQFGALNRWHSHALPFQSRSLPHLAFMGEEALAQTGVSTHWLAPIGSGAGTFEATFEVTASTNETLFGSSGDVSLLGHVNAFWNLSSSTDLDLGMSWIGGSYEDAASAGHRNLYGVETAFTWRPPERARYRGVTFRGGVMMLTGLAPDLPAPPPGTSPAPLLDGHALGYWTMVEARVGMNWLLGARFDRTENPRDTAETAWLVSPTVTWWQSEFVRVRMEYDLLGRSFLETDEGRLLIQVTFAMGPHKHENY